MNIMGCFYKEIELQKKPRGIHLITEEIYNKCEEIKNIEKGLMTVFIKHTSASICINENTDELVRKDLKYYLDKNIPENDPNYKHTIEGSDDMPAHIKTILIGNSVQIPVNKGKMSLGIWQGIYFCEHRNKLTNRKVVITINY